MCGNPRKDDIKVLFQYALYLQRSDKTKKTSWSIGYIRLALEKCAKSNVEIGRDIVVALSLEKKYLTLKGRMLFITMPDDPTLEVAVLLMKE